MVFIAAALTVFLTERSERRNGEQKNDACVRAAFEKGYETRSDCAIDCSAMEAAKGLASIGTGGKKWKWKSFSLFVLSGALVCVVLESGFAQISNRIEWQSSNICPSSPTWMEIESVYSLHERRETFSEISVSANEEILPEMFDISVTTRRKNKISKKVSNFASQRALHDFLFGLRHQITFVRDFFPVTNAVKSRIGLNALTRW